METSSSGDSREKGTWLTGQSAVSADPYAGRVQIGTIQTLRRFPVKAMAGQRLDEASVGWHGIEGDRRWAFVQSDSTSDFPWLTMRQVPALTTYVPREGAVRTPGGRLFDLDSAELEAELAAAHGGPVHLHRNARGLFDALPLSLISLQAIAALSAMVSRSLEPHRFRMSVIADLPGGADFPEDELVGRTIALGDEVRMRVDVRDSRCMVINFDPETAERDPAILRAVATQREQCLGVYGSVVRPGVVRAGDPIAVVA
jgi:hypothetical protein